jgi:molybdopterin-guanine dinucleotide biosynthesis protein A
MQGIATGLAALGGQAPAAFVCSTDMPFLHPAFVRRVVRGLDGGGGPGADVALPFARGFRQPLAAAYRTSLTGLITSLIAQGRSRPGMLYEHCTVTHIDDAELLADPDVARLDPDLDSVVNVNGPDDYAAARARPAAEVVVRCAGEIAGEGRRGPRPVRAATLSAAAGAVGLVLDRCVVATLNGDPVRDPLLPLVAGDVVAFLPADAGDK